MVTPNKVGNAMENCANPHALLKFLARTFSYMYIFNEYMYPPENTPKHHTKTTYPRKPSTAVKANTVIPHISNEIWQRYSLEILHSAELFTTTLPNTMQPRAQDRPK